MKIIHGDCLEVLKTLDDNSIDSVVTDPPYGLSFMGKKWDYDVPKVEVWEEAIRVLKPGGYLLSFAGTRTYHRMAVNIEDAGFEIRDMIAWVYGSGFPKSLNIGKAVDKLQGGSREVVGQNQSGSERNCMAGDFTGGKYDLTKGTSEWEGWGTALKPAHEPIVVARKPPSEKTVALNVLKWGTGGINIDGSRVGGQAYTQEQWRKKEKNRVTGNTYGKHKPSKTQVPTGRFPANLIHDGSDEVVGLFPNTKSGNLNTGHKRGDGTGNSFMGGGGTIKGNYGGDSGSASRFFYCAKASKSERNKGCEGLEEREGQKLGRVMNRVENGIITNERKEKVLNQNNHPTVKPIALMEYLIKLVSREGATILDPFAGSGTTGLACQNLGRKYILIEKELEYVKIIKARLRQKALLDYSFKS